jgi:hypothetical protein
MKSPKINVMQDFKPLMQFNTLISSAKRPGSLSILNAPSRFGHVLHYPNGSKIKDPPK